MSRFLFVEDRIRTGWRGRRQGNEVLRSVHQFAIEPPIVISPDAAASHVIGRLVDPPSIQSSAVQNELVTSADDHDGLVGRGSIKVVPVG